jgi:preprotein translocase subunit SecA
MSDATFARALAGVTFRRAESERDERAGERSNPVENFLRELPGWLPPGRERRRAIAAFDAAVRAVALALREHDDAAVAERLHGEMRALKAAPTRLHRDPRLAAVFACIGEASRRRLGMWPHPVQFTGARLLLSGCLAEMQTGEGKTLVAALAATAMAASGASVHVVSANDYLAGRDCEEMTPLFSFFGLGAGIVQGGMEAAERGTAYRHDICYVAGKELVFDYLKDRLAGHGIEPARVTRLRRLWSASGDAAAEPIVPALHFAIVDEADSVLIDEARTPMILSRETAGIYAPEVLRWAVDSARGLHQGRHFRIGSERDLELLPGALAECAALPDSVRGAWRSAPWRELLLRQALSALHLFLRDQHYILVDEKVQIVDESTGRVMADRSWEQGLQQMIETKEGLPATQGRETMARMTFQRFFRRYFLLAGLTGTAAEASRELWSVYRLPVRRVPPNRPARRSELPARCEPTPARKWQAVADEAGAAQARGQPVLVGTRSVEASEEVAAEFVRRQLDHVVLNARQDGAEAEIVSLAGRSGRITVATNMAGRGTDIKLTPDALAAGGLHVVLTEFHESPRVDRQLFGRSGRQGEAGTVRAIVGAEDALFAHQPAWLRRILARSAGPLQRAALRWAVRRAQAHAEAAAYKARVLTLRQDRELNRMIGFAGRQT